MMMTTTKMRTPPMIRLVNDPKESSSAVAKALRDSAVVVVPAFDVGTVKTGRVVVEVVISSHSTSVTTTFSNSSDTAFRLSLSVELN